MGNFDLSKVETRGTPLTNEIIFVNPTAKPTRPSPAPTPEAPAEASAPQVKRIRIGWGAEGHKGVAARSAEQANASADDRQQTKPELVKVRRTVSESRSFSEAPPRIEMGRVERYSKLEQIRGQRILSEKLDQGLEKRPALEHLTILHSRSAQQYWIADAETGDIFLRQPFATPQHCYEAAAELEQTFDMAEVLMLRPSETMERIGELVHEHWLRERVAVALR